MTERRSIKQTAAEIQSGRTVVDVVEDSLALAEGLNPEHHSFITIVRDAALSQAAKADARRLEGKQQGLLDGVPFAAKDMFETAGILTTGGSPVLEDNVPGRSALVVTRLEEAGAVLIGKANQHEFAYGATGENGWSGTTRNPFDTTRLAGGSSGGSAAAVAAGIVPYALGTDTGGSVRVPAALCGVVGFKPSFGRMSLQGVIPYCWSLDHAGIFANNVEDVALVFDQTTSVGQAAVPKNLKVGIVKGWAERSEATVRHAFLTAKTALEQMGASFTEIELPDQSEARTVSLTIQLAETLAYHGPNLARAGASFGKDMLSGMALGQFLSAECYIQCKRMLEVYNRAFSETMSTVDVLLTPGCPITAPKVGALHVEVGGDNLPVGNALTLFTSFFNLVGTPAIALPVSEETATLPVSVQLVGGRNRDYELLATAQAFEEVLRATNKIAA
ncbi:amidase, Asp-tRNAAsn/Glu-tRNAGln amidotransferase A subunit [Rhizobium leguminosarum bv. trifolii WSM2297]|uniref:Indoleacetamide hydrolase n=1 Tax=Rhizobium leguminosarum bv. trifolii WSM2297 TaxID=754762 RepID=J0W4R6_RHILT|nr:amidase [Rhizobium leguminosarum]EJC80701.1 amidase, Asp-tRNAAsn/Glu-tRNAGln amidotransferase A subunit [Rhizobium leguminosarum bv. trifolii WSM2297]